MIAVQQCGPDDWPAWRTLRRAALIDAPQAFGSTIAEWTGAGDTEPRWRDRLVSVPLNVVMTLDGQAAGMVSAIAPDSDGAVELIGLWVVPAARGRGVGDAAVEAVMQWALDQRARSVELRVRAANDPAQTLYRRCGFVDAGPAPDDPSERIMRRALLTSPGCRESP